MKKVNVMVLVCFVFLGLAWMSGCGEKPAASSQAAIEQSKAKGSVQEQVNYLAAQAKSFVNSKNFDEAVNVANYILTNLDKNSQAAKDILMQAKAEMQKTAESTMNDMKNKLGNLGK